MQRYIANKEDSLFFSKSFECIFNRLSAFMNLLYINTPGTDYSQDILYSGLRNRKDVQLYEFPFNKRFHFPIKQYPRNLGFVPGYFFNSLSKSIQIPWSKIDAVILAACNPIVFKKYDSIKSKLPSHCKIVFNDGGDWAEVGGDLERLGNADLYRNLPKNYHFDLVLKREMLIDKDYEKNVIPFPFGFNIAHIPSALPSVKKYDVSFWAVESHPVRTQVLNLLKNQFDCAANGTMTNQQFSKYKRQGKFYLQELAACKIVLNFRGAGWDTLRYWETPALGTFMISQKPGIIIPDNFTHGEEIIYCKDDLSDLLELCHYYLNNETERERIAVKAKEKLLNFHSESARAAYVLEHIEKL